MAVLLLAVLAALGGCHRPKPQVATQADVAAAQDEARKELEQARIEARKDLKSATKVSGGDSRVVAEARVSGSFDIAMAKADGDHKVALQTCMTLEPTAQPPCKNQADSDYQAAVASAKAQRASQQQR